MEGFGNLQRDPLEYSTGQGSTHGCAKILEPETELLKELKVTVCGAPTETKIVPVPIS